jgi:predicted neutral ceramidase superfamily lipid hydrolase
MTQENTWPVPIKDRVYRMVVRPAARFALYVMAFFAVARLLNMDIFNNVTRDTLLLVAIPTGVAFCLWAAATTVTERWKLYRSSLLAVCELKK